MLLAYNAISKDIRCSIHVIRYKVNTISNLVFPDFNPRLVFEYYFTFFI